MGLAEIIRSIREPDGEAMANARVRHAKLTKPPGSLGLLETLSIRLAGIFGTDRPRIRNPAVVLAAADHGVTAQGVTGYPQEVTRQMIENFVRGGAAVSVFGREFGVRVVVADCGVKQRSTSPSVVSMWAGPGTGDISVGPAMSVSQAKQCILNGARLAQTLVHEGVDLIALGEMGIGNTTPSAALLSALTGATPEQTTGRGTGRTDEQLIHKVSVVRRALEVNRAVCTDPLSTLAALGGFEIATLVGVTLGAASMRRPVVLDGFITTVSALVAVRLAPRSRDYLFAGHLSPEPGHCLALNELKLEPLLALKMRLGEGSGAVLAIGLLRAAAASLAEMATFAEAGIEVSGVPA